jgi:N-acetylglucosaminyl-diphospho-decaprenol L-rhamnosyltransferase
MIGSAAEAVDAVIVTYNSAAVIGSCLASLPPGPSITVVDNGSSDDTLAVARATRPEARVLRTPRNIGYGAAANLGFARGKAPYAILINPDAVLAEGAVAALVAAGERYPDAGLLAPRSRDPSGRIEFRARTAHARFLTNPRGVPAEPEGDCCAPYVGGAIMMFRRAALDAVGGFDERFFLSGEDDDINLRLSAAGWSLVHVAEAEAFHIGGRSSAMPRLAWWMHWHKQWARLYLARKHGGAGRLAPWRSFAVTAAKAAGYRLLGNSPKGERYTAEASACLAFALGREAQEVGIGQDHGTGPLAASLSSEAS